ncbi:MAG: bacteriochlorophyll 4-vinyl reductase [Geminicoccaceae bacterium]
MTGNGARIGPNALIQVAETLKARLGHDVCRDIFTQADLAAALDAPPTTMVPEADVIRLHTVLRRSLGVTQAIDIAQEAGRRTGDYLLANRIPDLVQRVLRLLPSRLASRALLAAIGKNSWTFVGSGELSIEPGRPAILTVHNCPLCRETPADAPLCTFYAGTFQRLFQVIVAPATSVRETACRAMGAPACTFRVDW